MTADFFGSHLLYYSVQLLQIFRIFGGVFTHDSLLCYTNSVNKAKIDAIFYYK